MKMCYLAGAVDMVIPEKARGWRKKVSAVLNKYGIHTYDPAAAFCVSRVDNDTWLSKKDTIIKLNNIALDDSEIVLAEMEFNCQHTGTVTELVRASQQQNKTVVIWNSSQYTPLYLADIPGAVIKPTLADCVAYIVESAGKQIAEEDYAALESFKGQTPTIKIKLLDEHPLKKAQQQGLLKDIDPAMLLFKKYNNDTGFDIIIAEDITLPPGGWKQVPTHLAIQPPENMWYRIVSRSSTFYVREMEVVEGIIDNQFRGPLFIIVKNTTDKEQTILAGESVAQLIFHEIVGEDWQLQIVDELDPSERGTNGFGSTTRHKDHILQTYQQYKSL